MSSQTVNRSLNTVKCVGCGKGAPYDFHPDDAPKHLFQCCHRLWCGDCLVRLHNYTEPQFPGPPPHVQK